MKLYLQQRENIEPHFTCFALVKRREETNEKNNNFNDASFPFILVCSQGKYHINGILNNDYNGKYVKLFQFQGDTLITSIDSAKVQKGKFSFKGKANVDEFAIVTIGKYPYIKSVEVVLEEGDIRVYMDTAFVASEHLLMICAIH